MRGGVIVTGGGGIGFASAGHGVVVSDLGVTVTGDETSASATEAAVITCR